MSRLRSRKARRRARLLVQILDETQESLPIKIMKYYLLFSGIVVTIGLLFFGIWYGKDRTNKRKRPPKMVNKTQ